MLTEDPQAIDESSSLDLSGDFEQALLEIDASFESTMIELQRLHQKKIDLITLYKEAKESEQLLKIRDDLKKTA
ncbi:MAG: hypothetical protein ACOYMB_02940 [Patescibacteria group bacterium]